MQRLSILSLTAALALAVLPLGAGANDASTTPDARHAAHREHRELVRNASDEERAVLRDLRRIESVYRREGMVDQLPALYRDVLAKTRNATVQTLATARLERLHAPKPDPVQTLASLRNKLDGDLANLE